MKTYITVIQHTQTTLLALSIGLLLLLPSSLAFFPSLYETALMSSLFFVAHTTVFLVMCVRPLADILRGNLWIRPLVILRKGFGVLSASIIVSFMLAKGIADPSGFLSGFLTLAYWSPLSSSTLAHIADLCAIALLITSNNYSKRILGMWWKRIQKLAYVYFYSSALYIFIMFHDILVLWFMIIVTILTLLAYRTNTHIRARTLTPTTPTPSIQ